MNALLNQMRDPRTCEKSTALRNGWKTELFPILPVDRLRMRSFRGSAS